MGIVYFKTAAAFRTWLKSNHAKAPELWVRFHRKDSGLGGLTYPKAVDEALCFGWIDGLRKKVDDISYTNRFTPRRARSTWSRVNIRRVAELQRLGRMTAAGLQVFARRTAGRSGTYSFEQRKNPSLDPASTRQLRADAAAWAFFQRQAPSYQRTATWWVVSAKRPATRQKRLQILISCSAAGRRIPPLTPSPKSG